MRRRGALLASPKGSSEACGQATASWEAQAKTRDSDRLGGLRGQLPEGSGPGARGDALRGGSSPEGSEAGPAGGAPQSEREGLTPAERRLETYPRRCRDTCGRGRGACQGQGRVSLGLGCRNLGPRLVLAAQVGSPGAKGASGPQRVQGRDQHPRWGASQDGGEAGSGEGRVPEGVGKDELAQPAPGHHRGKETESGAAGRGLRGRGLRGGACGAGPAGAGPRAPPPGRFKRLVQGRARSRASCGRGSCRAPGPGACAGAAPEPPAAPPAAPRAPPPAHPRTLWPTRPAGPACRMVAHNQVAADNAISTAAESRRRPEPSPTSSSSSSPSSSSSSSPSSAAPARARPCAPPAAPTPAPAPAAAPGDTHFRTFRSQAEYRRITRASALLEACGFYWGPLNVHGAHERLRAEPVGTFLVRDSRQRNCFFALSVKMASGPTSIRVHFQAGRFHLDGSRESFDCLFELLEHYVAAPRRMLGAPLRQRRVRPLQELCRQRIVATVGRENLARIPLNPVLRDYLSSFPFQI
uniref:Suppressor of cytokine signaling 1 n=6 Tax=Boreoeutheria TaxID=1437010 RepID=A0A8C0N2S5_CANLF